MHRPTDEGAPRPAGSPAVPFARPEPLPFPDGVPAPWCGSGVPDPALVDPLVLGALLHRHGWRRRGGAAGRYARWTPPGPGTGSTSLLVPESREFPDCEDLLGEALTALAGSAAPSAREVLVGLAVPSDEVRWWRDVPQGPSGAASWTVQEQLRSAARQFLLAGALAVRGRAGYHGARHRRQARAVLEGVLVGPAPGGRGLTAFLPVDTGRSVAVRLHHALHAAREAVDYQRATGGMDAFDTAVAAGVSRELTEALVALVRGAEGARIAVAWSPSAGVPEGCAARPEPVEFSPGDLPALRAAGARYLREEPSVPVRVTGTVVRMRRSGTRGEGTVRLRVLAGAEVPYVRAVLDEESYRTAGHAHLVGLPIRVVGRLESRGGFRRLSDAGEVVPVQVDEAERDRLMKALHENLDFFEEACGGED
ncbi:hypothetical protein AB0K47_20010 [Streptomyces tirandamycinicus]|uniref:hypothetical protein n=1 Tax=Streptomyces TaxID=1883 RepID=UPI00036F8FAD|nr:MULTISPECIES: hypothetical protein [Streptomyces]MCY0979748.1 hypothetical protein [Streptomyces tirandamycinicus]NNJ07667.1 hypothetical protein [Streptomyces sp. PKU-MA01144]TFE38696.1 hypothetical protein E3E14_27275 [Streptomyces sp. ICN441]